MAKELIITNYECRVAALQMARNIRDNWKSPSECFHIYGIPRGGIPVAYLLHGALTGLRVEAKIVDGADEADIFVDDIIDSGTTRERYNSMRDIPFLALADFMETPSPRPFLVFPWERGPQGEDQSATDIPLRLLQYIGEDPKRGGLKETPQRFLKAWKHWTSGYGMKPSDVIKTFSDGAENYDEMIWCHETPFYSHCEHHLAPFFGTATIAYVPDKRVIGASKLSRILDIFARRLQIQERLTTQVAHAVQEALEPKGVGVVIRARHLCMESRGIQKQGHQFITCCTLGALREDGRARSEFLSVGYK